MPQCVVIADDLTGANATGVLLKKMDYQTYTVMNTDLLEMSSLIDCDCLIYPTDSRGIDAQSAYERVYRVTKSLETRGVKVYSKRIDSTLRGNLGSETSAILDALGDSRIAIVVPCLPALGRIVIGGYMLVNSLPLHKTEVALDPKTPITTSKVKDLFTKQSKYPVADIKMADMMDGAFLAKKIKNLIGEGNRILIFDCITQEDMDLIADSVITSKIEFVAVDPGAFTATIARKLITPIGVKEKKKILAVVGSVNPVTKAQMEEVWLTQRTVHNTFVSIKELLEGEAERESEISRVSNEVIKKSSSYDILTVTGDGMFSEKRVDFKQYMMRDNCKGEDLSNIVNKAFADIAYRIFHCKQEFKGLYTSGGDITASVCERFKTGGFCLLDEVLPLAAYGKFLQGEFEGLHIITKGGMVGEKNAINHCLTYLKEKLYM